MAFGALFVFALIIAVITLTGLNRTQAAYDNALTHGVEIRRLSDPVGEQSLASPPIRAREAILHWREKGLDYASHKLRNFLYAKCCRHARRS